MIVVDASVAVKWFLPEAGEAAAQSLLDGEDRLAAPGLVRVEVAAALVRKARLRQISADEARTALALWFRALAEGVLVILPDEADLEAAAQIALDLEHPVQDCLYLAAARRLGSPLVTADKKFARRSAGHYPEVELLSLDGP